MKKIVLLFTVLVLTASLSGQTIFENYEKVEALLRIGPEPERQIWMTEKGHTLILPPDVDSIAGVAIFFQRGKIPVEKDYQPKPGSFDHAAFERGVAVLHVATGNPLDFFFDDSTMAWVSGHIQDVLEKQDLQGVPVLFAGLSLGGTRALKLAQYLIENDDTFWLMPSAVAVVDAPLDMERLWYDEIRAAELGFNDAAADEGRWVTYLLKHNLGGSPKESYYKYIAYSVYTHTAENGGRIGLLKAIPVRAYHEPDVNWWIENRRKSYYDMNSIDLAAMINELRIVGNSKAELVTTHNQRDGFAEGSSPHTWSIVDNAELIDWFLKISHQ